MRKPPYEKWDIAWLDEPLPLEGVKIVVDADKGQLQKVFAARPYYFEKPQQPVQEVVEAETSGSNVEITVPDFRYNTMVVFRFGK